MLLSTSPSRSVVICRSAASISATLGAIRPTSPLLPPTEVAEDELAAVEAHCVAVTWLRRVYRRTDRDGDLPPGLAGRLRPSDPGMDECA